MRKQVPLVVLLLAGAMASAQDVIAISAYAVNGFDTPAAYEGFVIDAFTAELSRYPAVRTLDRRALDLQLKEMELNLSGLVDSNGAVAAGNVLGAHWILTGSLGNFGGKSAVLSTQLISTATGVVAFAMTEIIAGSDLAPIQDRIRVIAKALVERLKPGAKPVVDSLWLTKAAGDEAPILLWVMSNIDDAEDPNGVWYMGPAQLKPLTDRLKNGGHGVVAHDRRTLAHLADIDLSDFSQVWIVEGDGDGQVDVTQEEVDALERYYMQGGKIWLSAENVLEPGASWVEDINAFARPFGASVGGIVITAEPGLAVESLTGPLFAGIRKVVYDDEIGVITTFARGFSVLLEAPASSRIVNGIWSSAEIVRYALKERLRELETNPLFTYRWLFGANFGAIGRAAGRGKAVMVLKDERAVGKGMLLVDSGWLIGWAFNGAQGRVADVGQNTEFLLNVAAYFAKH